MNMPKVSVLMTMCNQAEFVNEAIQSILSQSFSDWELIITDDASDDDGVERVKKVVGDDPRVKIIRNNNRLGVSVNRNNALKVMCGEYVAVLDADDMWVDCEKLSKQAKYLDIHKDCVLVSGNAQYIDARGASLGQTRFPEFNNDIRRVILSKNIITHSSAMYRREIANQVGNYANFRVGEDYELWLRLGQKGKFYIFPEILVKYRRSRGQATRGRIFEILKTNYFLVGKYSKYYPNAFIAWCRRGLRCLLYYPVAKLFSK